MKLEIRLSETEEEITLDGIPVDWADRVELVFVRGQKPTVTFGFDPDNVTPGEIPEDLADKFVNGEAVCREIAG